jgi:hypothetical protein
MSSVNFMTTPLIRDGSFDNFLNLAFAGEIKKAIQISSKT